MGGVGAILASLGIYFSIFIGKNALFFQGNVSPDIVRLDIVQYGIDSPETDGKFFVVFRGPYLCACSCFLNRKSQKKKIWRIQAPAYVKTRYVALTPRG